MVMLSAKLVERAQVLIKTKKSMFGSEDKTEKYVYIIQYVVSYGI